MTNYLRNVELMIVHIMSHYYISHFRNQQLYVCHHIQPAWIIIYNIYIHFLQCKFSHRIVIFFFFFFLSNKMELSCIPTYQYNLTFPVQCFDSKRLKDVDFKEKKTPNSWCHPFILSFLGRNRMMIMKENSDTHN